MVNPESCFILIVSEFPKSFLKTSKVSLAWRLEGHFHDHDVVILDSHLAVNLNKPEHGVLHLLNIRISFVEFVLELGLAVPHSPS